MWNYHFIFVYCSKILHLFWEIQKKSSFIYVLASSTYLEESIILKSKIKQEKKNGKNFVLFKKETQHILGNCIRQLRIQ